MKNTPFCARCSPFTPVPVLPRTGTRSAWRPKGAYPFNLIAADGSLQGFDIDIGNALCDEMKAKYLGETGVGRHDPGAGLAQVRCDHRLDVDHRRTQGQVDFTEKYYASPRWLIAKKGSTLRPDLPPWPGRRSASSAARWSDNRHEILGRQGMQIIRYAKQDEAYLDLRAGRLDAAFSDYLEAYGGF